MDISSALSSISSTYKQVEDLKKERENELKSQIFNPNMREIVKELENLSQQEKVVEQQNAKVASAQRQTTKVGDAQSLEKLEAAKRSLRENQDKLHVSMEAFLRTEPERIAILQKAAEIECEYYRKAAEAFQELQNELTGIKERVTTSPVVSNRTDYYMESPRQEFAFSTVVGAPDPVPQSNGSQEPCCRALHTFEAELDEDLPFHENQIIKLIEKVDDDWYFGELNGRRGHFPANFVEVVNAPVAVSNWYQALTCGSSKLVLPSGHNPGNRHDQRAKPGEGLRCCVCFHTRTAEPPRKHDLTKTHLKDDGATEFLHSDCDVPSGLVVGKGTLANEEVKAYQRPLLAEGGFVGLCIIDGGGEDACPCGCLALDNPGYAHGRIIVKAGRPVTTSDALTPGHIAEATTGRALAQQPTSS
ncbi:unnamed protein product [Schistocephalus solidus]|uniref:SH3 domain-containing protein n=1 Tax=Schistocephalus solidus TaxID=70667 RepID=A0A183SQP8_SCHSO|nr:unnamed protein product [Schistocephalus solidus]